jgi:hypothetical protein
MLARENVKNLGSEMPFSGTKWRIWTTNVVQKIGGAKITSKLA